MEYVWLFLYQFNLLLQAAVHIKNISPLCLTLPCFSEMRVWRLNVCSSLPIFLSFSQIKQISNLENKCLFCIRHLSADISKEILNTSQFLATAEMSRKLAQKGTSSICDIKPVDRFYFSRVSFLLFYSLKRPDRNHRRLEKETITN